MLKGFLVMFCCGFRTAIFENIGVLCMNNSALVIHLFLHYSTDNLHWNTLFNVVGVVNLKKYNIIQFIYSLPMVRYGTRKNW